MQTGVLWFEAIYLQAGAGESQTGLGRKDLGQNHELSGFYFFKFSFFSCTLPACVLCFQVSFHPLGKFLSSDGMPRPGVQVIPLTSTPDQQTCLSLGPDRPGKSEPQERLESSPASMSGYIHLLRQW